MYHGSLRTSDWYEFKLLCEIMPSLSCIRSEAFESRSQRLSKYSRKFQKPCSSSFWNERTLQWCSLCFCFFRFCFVFLLVTQFVDEVNPVSYSFSRLNYFGFGPEQPSSLLFYKILIPPLYDLCNDVNYLVMSCPYHTYDKLNKSFLLTFQITLVWI